MTRNQGIQVFEFLLRPIARIGVLRYSQSSSRVLKSVPPSRKQAASRSLEKAGRYAQHVTHDSAPVGDGKKGIKYLQYLCACFQRNVPHGFQPFEYGLRHVVPGEIVASGLDDDPVVFDFNIIHSFFQAFHILATQDHVSWSC